MSNLFASAKKKTTKTATSKNEKTVVVVKGSEFNESLKVYNDTKKEIANLTSKLKMAEGVVKEAGIEEFKTLYTGSKRNPGSFKLASESGEKVLFVPVDRYLKVDEERVEELREGYGEDIVTEAEVFSFNSALLAKYGEELSELISGADFMTDDEKAELIVASSSYSVKKGAINEAYTLGKGEVEDFVEDIQPVYQLKNTR